MPIYSTRIQFASSLQAVIPLFFSQTPRAAPLTDWFPYAKPALSRNAGAVQKGADALFNRIIKGS